MIYQRGFDAGGLMICEACEVLETLQAFCLLPPFPALAIAVDTGPWLRLCARMNEKRGPASTDGEMPILHSYSAFKFLTGLAIAALTD